MVNNSKLEPSSFHSCFELHKECSISDSDIFPRKLAQPKHLRGRGKFPEGHQVRTTSNGTQTGLKYKNRSSTQSWEQRTHRNLSQTGSTSHSANPLATQGGEPACSLTPLADSSCLVLGAEPWLQA